MDAEEDVGLSRRGWREFDRENSGVIRPVRFEDLLTGRADEDEELPRFDIESVQVVDGAGSESLVIPRASTGPMSLYLRKFGAI